MTAVRVRIGWLLWPLAVLAVLTHLGLGLLAALEYARLDWLFSEPHEFLRLAWSSAVWPWRSWVRCA